MASWIIERYNINQMDR